MRLIVLSTLLACAAFAQSSDSVIFRAVMLPENEVPAARIDARATAQLRARIVRDASGQIVSGSLDFTILHTFAAAQTLVGLHIHRGVAGVNGPVVIDSGISGTASVIAEPGRNGFARQAQIRPTDTAALLALRELVEDPASFYVNLHTPEFPGGVIRGQVDATLVSQFVTALSPANEIPAISGSAASGLCAIQVIRGFDGQGKFSYGEVLFEAAYDFKEQVTVNGFHIHQGGPDMNAPVVINTGISGAAPLLTPEGGSGAGSYTVEFGPALANEILLGDLSRFPDLFYVNMHTTAFPGGLIRGQLREAETRRFDLTMLPSSEVPPITGLAATAVSNVQAFAARGATGSFNAALVVFDVAHP